MPSSAEATTAVFLPASTSRIILPLLFASSDPSAPCTSSGPPVFRPRPKLHLPPGKVVPGHPEGMAGDPLLFTVGSGEKGISPESQSRGAHTHQFTSARYSGFSADGSMEIRGASERIFAARSALAVGRRCL